METKYIMLFAIILLLAIIILRIQIRAQKRRMLLNQYRKAIRSGNKERALIAGRAYYRFLRKGRLSIYDEQAINNDLSTMEMSTVLNQSLTVNTKSEVTVNNQSVVDQLEKLVALKNQGGITEEEFLTEKTRLLNRQ